MMLPKTEVSGKGKKPEELDGVPECGSWKRVVPEHQKKLDGWLTEVFNRMSQNGKRCESPVTEY